MVSKFLQRISLFNCDYRFSVREIGNHEYKFDTFRSLDDAVQYFFEMIDDNLSWINLICIEDEVTGLVFIPSRSSKLVNLKKTLEEGD